jgi:hypothetical protein
MNFLLLVLLALDGGVSPVYIDRFETLAECEEVRVLASKDIPAGVPYVSSCVPIRRDDTAS